MITEVVFVPSTPMLIPAVSAGASAELDDLRGAAVSAVSRAAAAADDVVIVGAGLRTRRLTAGIGSLRGFGVPMEIALGRPALEQIGVAGTIGLWLLEQASWQGQTTVQEIAADLDGLAAAGADLASARGARALVVVGDGSAARSEKAPGYLHPDGEVFDSVVEQALRTGDAAALATLDPARADDVLAGGVPAWRATALALAGTSLIASVTYAAAPYGVGYFVAEWRRG